MLIHLIIFINQRTIQTSILQPVSKNDTISSSQFGLGLRSPWVADSYGEHRKHAHDLLAWIWIQNKSRSSLTTPSHCLKQTLSTTNTGFLSIQHTMGRLENTTSLEVNSFGVSHTMSYTNQFVNDVTEIVTILYQTMIVNSHLFQGLY